MHNIGYDEGKWVQKCFYRNNKSPILGVFHSSVFAGAALGSPATGARCVGLSPGCVTLSNRVRLHKRSTSQCVVYFFTARFKTSNGIRGGHGPANTCRININPCRGGRALRLRYPGMRPISPSCIERTTSLSFPNF